MAAGGRTGQGTAARQDGPSDGAAGPLACSLVPDSPPFVYRAPVRYYEVDQQGVVFNMWYLGYCDEACSGFLAQLPGGRLGPVGLDIQLVHAEVDWRGSLRSGDEAHVHVRADTVGTTSFTLLFEVRNGSDLDVAPLVLARIVYVVVAEDGSGKRPVPDDLRAALTAST